MNAYTTQVYYDYQDFNNLGWAYRCDVHGDKHGMSGPLDGYERETSLTRKEAFNLAQQALEEDYRATQVTVYWNGDDSDPVTFLASELVKQ